MRKFLSAAAVAIALSAVAQPASASHIFFEDVSIGGVALDSLSGQTNPTFTVNQGDSLTFTVHGEGAGGDVINAWFTGLTGVAPNQVSFAFSGGHEVFNYTLTFANAGTYLANVLLDIPSSTPDYVTPQGYQVDTANFDFQVDVLTSAVPEPGTWAMMILGLGGVGAALRSRRQQAAAAA